MTWTRKKPIQPGWYWYKGGSDSLPLAVEIMNWSPLPGHPRDLHMFYPPRNPEETGICSLDLVDEGEWEGPIAPGIGMPPQQVIARSETRLQQPPPPPPPPRQREPLQSTPAVQEADPVLMKEVLAWFITVGAEYMPREIHQKQLVDLANLLAPAFRIKSSFTSVNDVIGFMMDRTETSRDEFLRN